MDYSSIAYSIVIILVISIGILFKYSGKKLLLLKQVSLWVIIIIIISVLYNNRYRFEDAKNQLIATFLPSYPIYQDGHITVQKSDDGHFYMDMLVNEKEKIRFMIDTGASITTLAYQDALKLNIDTEGLTYDKIFYTANGPIKGATITLDSIEIAGIIFNNVKASVSKSNLEQSLIGMNFLSEFRKYETDRQQMKLIL